MYADIGEELRQQYEELSEDKRQRTIRSVEEVIRREEAAKAEEKLTAANSEWLKERQVLFQEAHQSQLRAIARQNSILETKLREEFASTLKKLTQKHEETLARKIDNTWAEAEAVKQEAVEEARQEEVYIARVESCKVAATVSEIAQQNNQQAEEDKQEALSEQMELLKLEECRALERQKEELEGQFKDKLADVCDDYECRLGEVGRELDDQRQRVEELAIRLEAMTQLKDSWETKYENIRTEFSDFIDNVPGFRGEFVLK